MASVVNAIALPTEVTLPYVEQGDASGVPVLLLHGFAGSWREFELVLPHLPGSLHTLALTQRGHGEASKPRNGYQIRGLAADLAAFVDALGIGSAVVVGHSMGSAVAQRFALDYPARTRGLVLVSACVDEPGHAKVQSFWESTVSKLSDPIDHAFLRGFLDTTLAQPVPEATLEIMIQEAQKVPARVWKALWRARLEGGSTLELGEIQAPTLILWGDRDGRCSRSDQETLLAGIPNSRLVVYPGAGHGLPYEEPERLADDLAAFVRDFVASGSLNRQKAR
jgi:pimeloyl-ACP methyl ester carboxylesterase